jgi:hypothetical protein
MTAYPFIGVMLGFVLTIAWLAILVLVDMYREMRSPAVVSCPSTGLEAAVQLRPLEDRLPQVTGCSRWPAHRPCHQACVESLLLARVTMHSKRAD